MKTMRFYIKLLGLITVLAAIIVSCSKEQSVDPDISKIDSSIVAQYTLTAGSDSVILGTQVGFFYIDNSYSGYLKIPVKVTKSGAYNIDVVTYFGTDSVIFSGSGFTVAGDSIIKLYPESLSELTVGTYTVDNISKNHIYVNGAKTGFLLNTSIVVSESVVTPIGNIKDSTWSLLINGTDSVGGVFEEVVKLPNITNGYGMSGSNTDPNKTYNLALILNLPSTSSITTPVTLNSADPGSTIAILFINNNDSLFTGGHADSLSAPGSSAIITINQYDATTKEINGTFSGSLKRPDGGATYNVTKGVFKTVLP